jgi:tetratricopeptide (TPR) repeat protein
VTARGLDPDALAALEEERDFLLRSRRDLDRELAAGDIDDDDYRTLHDDYTARAAAVMRRIAAGEAALAGAPRPSPWRTVGVVVSVAVLAVGAGLAVARASGERLAGDQVSGSIRRTSSDVVAQALAEFQAGRPVAALELLDRAIAADPRNARALAYRGWLLRLAGAQSGRTELIDEGLRYVERAIAADPTYPDAHFFRGMILFADRNDPVAAVPEFEAFLANDPPADQVGPVTEILQRAREAAEGRIPARATPQPRP